MKKSSLLPHLNRGLPPTALTIFGATGHLSANYLLPALFHMDAHGLLPQNFKLVCVGRRDLNAESFLAFVIQKSKGLKGTVTVKAKRHFLKHLIYFKGNFDDPASFKPLAEILSDHEKPKHQCFNRLYYFATTPQLFASITHILKQSKLLMSCATHERKIRVLVEKPFGFNLKSAQALNHLLLKYFTEDQIYRIDHYVGKETVQNLMVVRFANSLFEPLWNNRFIDHVEISVLEKDGVGSRGQFYNSTGAIKDILQNHILQMLALIAMEEPYSLTSEMIRDEKLKVLQNLEPMSSEKLASRLVKGQYQDYNKDIGLQVLDGTGGTSRTETFFALKTYVNSPRWSGVPFYLRTGKKLSKKLTEISIHFREPIRVLFEGCATNILTFRIQPDEYVRLQINNKIPGFGVKLYQGYLDFNYGKIFKGELPTAYERLLLDFLEGDQRLFIRSDEIEAAWKFVDSITENPEFKNLPLHSYKAGSNGSKESEELITKDAKEWWTK